MTELEKLLAVTAALGLDFSIERKTQHGLTTFVVKVADLGGVSSPSLEGAAGYITKGLRLHYAAQREHAELALKILGGEP